MPLIHCIVFLYSPQSDNVLEIPTHQGVDLIYRSNGNVLCIREIGSTNCSLLNIHVRKIERALRYLHLLNIRLWNLVKQCLHALWRIRKFQQSQIGQYQSRLPCNECIDQASRRVLKGGIETAAKSGSITVNPTTHAN